MVALVQATVVAFEATICLGDSGEMKRPIAEHSWNRELDAASSINRPAKRSISEKPRTQHELTANLPAILLDVDKRHG